MDEGDLLARRFQAERPRLEAVAYRMLGSAAEAEDAVQEAWLRLARSDADAVQNLAGWLTTVVGRVCLDMLRSRTSRREAPLDEQPVEPAPDAPAETPESQALLSDSVGLALLVVLQTLDPAERLAFVLHDMFAVPFDEIAPIVDRTPAAARQLASRARRRVQGGTPQHPDLVRQRRIVDAFLSAARQGDFDALVSILDPDVVIRSDGRFQRQGAVTVARGASVFGPMAAGAHLILVDGRVGAVASMTGREYRVLLFGFAGDRIAEFDVISDPGRIHDLKLSTLD
ncbi:DNA-directed RNA polymerase sigma-70 factor [Actinocatenispora thailandica]|uniref:DNA-directed RNA polymerase sigma-70 factor n=1 Tax=Actinocatenispora thailandica TaxID=227318 RepID=A0A7R7DWS5_9ACTN|nr:sigma-70 family RNA polymerase sigma factor [Actinocatenispora thailandica]BCJ39327.1 DNA-directed RNA polymerase sigma-70 factor [Actinocatenispora thailandica]